MCARPFSDCLICLPRQHLKHSCDVTHHVLERMQHAVTSRHGQHMTLSQPPRPRQRPRVHRCDPRVGRTSLLPAYRQAHPHRHVLRHPASRRSRPGQTTVCSAHEAMADALGARQTALLGEMLEEQPAFLNAASVPGANEVRGAVASLSSADQSPNLQGRVGYLHTPLAVACACGSMKAVEMLLSYPDIEPLVCAGEGGNVSRRVADEGCPSMRVPLIQARAKDGTDAIFHAVSSPSRLSFGFMLS